VEALVRGQVYKVDEWCGHPKLRRISSAEAGKDVAG
jgi:hypothetical protein